MSRRLLIPLALLVALGSPTVYAQAGPPPLPESGQRPAAPPIAPTPSERARMADEGIEPEVTIIRHERTTVEEYRHNGQLYMVKIIPENGPPYYLVDTDGDGRLDTRTNDLSVPQVNRWILHRW